jgi:hypothetical protein
VRKALLEVLKGVFWDGSLRLWAVWSLCMVVTAVIHFPYGVGMVFLLLGLPLWLAFGVITVVRIVVEYRRDGIINIS